MWNPLRLRRERLERERLALLAERSAERDHQQQLLKTFLASLESIQTSAADRAASDSTALIEVAKGMTAQAQSFAAWLEMFKVSQPPTSSFVREEDEIQSEALRKLQAGEKVDIEDLPPELQLAYALQHDPNFGLLNEPMTP